MFLYLVDTLKEKERDLIIHHKFLISGYNIRILIRGPYTHGSRHHRKAEKKDYD